MESERRYDDSEIAAILEAAADAEVADRTRTHEPAGLTLAELQQVGAEAGLSPELIARAAANLEHPVQATRETRLLGYFPLGVSRAVPLPRPFSQEEWERLVAAFRHTFRARGRARSDGDLREWSNGNLHALVEPCGTGWVLRFGTRKSDAPGLVGLGTILLAAGVLFALLAVLGVADQAGLLTAFLLGMAGAGQLGWAALHLPRWAGDRTRQFEQLGREALHITSADDPRSGP